VGPPLDLVDVTLLVAGGFVVCGELLTPLLLAPVLQKSLGFLRADPALQQALAVLGMYFGLMSLPLLILWAQLRGKAPKLDGGWLQWRWLPLASALRRALIQVLMVLPLVTLVGWLFDQLVSKASGSNPLLELVLTTSNPWALLLFAITAIVLAPLFEETLFRGVLLPVLGKRFGGLWGVVISALVFGIAHLSLGELPALFVLGLGLGWLRLQSGRLAPSVLMHGLWNGLTFANLLLLAG
jgi:membrane protease YdiL (CAAX protease family)